MLKSLFLVGDLLHPAFPSDREEKMSKETVIPHYLAKALLHAEEFLHNLLQNLNFCLLTG